MISNCPGCQYEIEEAYRLQEDGFIVGLEGMGVRGHCRLFAFTKEGKIVIQ